ncbi:MAG: hypothetical protein ACD_79C01483G0001 [uncultured bacterium]|nr:MAG: hypothetical protein ACD_79C01483G0001 [uncultured bacterium]
MIKKLLAMSVISVLTVFSVYAETTITTAGSSTIKPIVDKASAAFKQKNPDVKFVIGGGGSSHGVKAAGTGEVMIGQCSREVYEKEKTAYPDLVDTKIALDGVAVIVNDKNPINNITKEQLCDIYTGKITNWKDVGGNDAPIEIISKEKGRSTLDLFLEFCEMEAEEVGDGNLKEMVHKKKGDASFSTLKAKLIGPNLEAIGAVALKPNAIAYVSIGTALDVKTKGGKLKLLDLEGVVASLDNVANQTYPLRRPLNVVTKGQPAGAVKDFIDFILSEEGQKIVESLDFIRVK